MKYNSVHKSIEYSSLNRWLVFFLNKIWLNMHVYEMGYVKIWMSMLAG